MIRENITTHGLNVNGLEVGESLWESAKRFSK
jgi:hypothetical protein